MTTHRTAWLIFLVARLLAPSLAAAQRIEDVLVGGLKLDSKEFNDSLSRPFWRALAASPCPKVSWRASYATIDAFERSRAPLRARLIREVGALQDANGLIWSRRALYQNSRYSVDLIAYTNRLRNASFGILARPLGIAMLSAPIVLVHGSGMAPQEAFDWRFPDQYAPNQRLDSAAFVGSALELVEAGYTVFALWLSDDELDDYWPLMPWQLVNRNGAVLSAKTGGPGTNGMLANEVVGAIDMLATLRGVDMSKLSLLGWGEGTQLAMVAAAMNNDVKAVVRLDAPIDRAALRTTVQGLFNVSPSNQFDCALGDTEMAALIAPRPLLYAYSTRDPSIARTAAFISQRVVGQIREMYTRLSAPMNFSVEPDSAWTPASIRSVRAWLDRAVGFDSRPVPSRVVAPPRPVRERYHGEFIDSTRLQRRQYIARLGACLTGRVIPDFQSPAAYARSVEPLRLALAASLRIPRFDAKPIFHVLRRDLVSERSGYALEYIEMTSNRTSIPVRGLLATPLVAPDGTLPAIISTDGNVGLATPFGLLGREPIPYLNAYADKLASLGSVVFVPYLPGPFPEIASSVLRGRNAGGLTSFSLVIPQYLAAIDFVSSLRAVDTSRIGMWGISYAAYPALFTTALDQRISALLFSNPVVTADLLFQSPDGAGLASWHGEICSMIDPALTYLIAPRRLVRENGARDANGYERTYLESIEKIKEVYLRLGVPGEFRFVQHPSGHETLPRSLF